MLSKNDFYYGSCSDILTSPCMGRQLTEELMKSKHRSEQSDKDLRVEVERLRRETERQQKLLHSVMLQDTEGGELKAAPGASDTLLQSEIMRLTNENMVRGPGELGHPKGLVILAYLLLRVRGPGVTQRAW